MVRTTILTISGVSVRTLQNANNSETQQLHRPTLCANESKLYPKDWATPGHHGRDTWLALTVQYHYRHRPPLFAASRTCCTTRILLTERAFFERLYLKRRPRASRAGPLRLWHGVLVASTRGSRCLSLDPERRLRFFKPHPRRSTTRLIVKIEKSLMQWIAQRSACSVLCLPSSPSPLTDTHTHTRIHIPYGGVPWMARFCLRLVDSQFQGTVFCLYVCVCVIFYSLCYPVLLHVFSSFVFANCLFLFPLPILQMCLHLCFTPLFFCSVFSFSPLHSFTCVRTCVCVYLCVCVCVFYVLF